MTWGFELVTSNGELTIDGEHQNLRAFKYAQRTDTAGSHEVSGGTERDVITISHGTRVRPPMVLVHPATTAVRMGSWHDDSGGEGEVNFMVSEDGDWEYALVDENPGLVDSDSYGMQVFAADGGVIFDSRERHVLKIRDVFAVDPSSWFGTDPDPTVDVSHASVSKPFYLINGIYGTTLDSTSSGAGSSYVYAPFVKNIDSTTVRFDWDLVAQYDQQLWQAKNYVPSHWLIMVVEFSGT